MRVKIGECSICGSEILLEKTCCEGDTIIKTCPHEEVKNEETDFILGQRELD